MFPRYAAETSGVVPSSFRILRRLLDRVEDPDTGRILVDELHVEIPAERLRQIEEVAANLGDVAATYPARDGLELLGTFAPPKGAAQIAATVLEGVFLSGPAVRFDSENQRPAPYAHALAEAACGALGRIGGPDAVPALERMRKAGEGGSGPSVKPVGGPVSDVTGWARDPRIAGFVQEALSKLR